MRPNGRDCRERAIPGIVIARTVITATVTTEIIITEVQEIS